MIFGPRTEKRPAAGGAKEEAGSEEGKSEASEGATEKESRARIERRELVEIREQPPRRGRGRSVVGMRSSKSGIRCP